MSDSGDHDPALENLLRTARILAPSARLDARLESVFAGESPQRSRMRLLPLAIAAGLVIAGAPVVWVLRTASVPPGIVRLTAASHPAASSPDEMRVEQDFSRVIDDGVVAVSDNTPYQQVRRQTVRDIWYIDPRTQSRLLVRVPIEQVLVEKVEAF